MGWLFKQGFTRRAMIGDRTNSWDHVAEDGTLVRSVCLAHCYRGGVWSGVLWTVWERTFSRGGQLAKPVERWIGCDLLRYETNYGWGYKDMEESMGPIYYSCPLGYLDLVPIEQFGGNAKWREAVRSHHEQRQVKRQERRRPSFLPQSNGTQSKSG